MSALIIPLFPSLEQVDDVVEEVRLYTVVNAALRFAKCALWPEQTFTKEEEEATKEYISEYFRSASDEKRAFTALIERIVFTQKYVRQSPEHYLPLPSVWFNRRYPFGFAGTLLWLKKVETQRKDIPGYLGHVEDLAKGYYDYSIKPTLKNFHECRKRLSRHKAHSLLQLFYNTVALTKNRRA